jgi:hypothetical protein
VTENRQVMITALSYPISIYILFTGAKSESRVSRPVELHHLVGFIAEVHQH